MTRKRLDELLAKLEPRMAKRFRGLMQRVKGTRSVASLEVALEAGTVAKILDEIELAAGMLAEQSAAVNRLVGGEVATYLGGKLDKLVSYDGSNPRAVAALQRNRLEFMWGMREEARLSIGEAQRISEALAQGLGTGVNPRTTAILIRDSIGLTADQTRWVANYRRKLETLDRGALKNKLRNAGDDKAVLAAIDAGKPLPQARIDRMVDRYAARQLKYRSEVIAKFETMKALEMGQFEGVKQAVDADHVTAERMQGTWHQRARENKRESHVPMRGQRRVFGLPFRTGNGVLMKHPHDPDAPLSECIGCGCFVTWRVLPEGQVAVSGDGPAAQVDATAESP